MKKQQYPIAIGADHHGFAQKQLLMQMVTEHNAYEVVWHDVGAFDNQRSDYPLFAQQVCALMLAKTVERGILLCGTGIGMGIMANRYCGIYAGIAWNKEVAICGRHDDNTNVLVIPSDFVASEDVEPLVRAWLGAEFLGDRYARRIAMIDHVTCKNT